MSSEGKGKMSDRTDYELPDPENHQFCHACGGEWTKELPCVCEFAWAFGSEDETSPEADVNEILDYERAHAVGFTPDEITAALQDPTRRRLT